MVIEEVTRAVAVEFHMLHGEIDLRGQRILRLMDLLKASYCLSIGSDCIHGLDVCDNFRDYVRSLGIQFDGQIHKEPQP